MTTINPTPQQKVVMLKHLVAGRDLDFIADITGLSRDDVLDIVSTHGYPNKDRMGWAIDALTKNLDKIPERAPTSIGKPRVLLTDVPRPGPTVVAVATVRHLPPATADLLHRGKTSEHSRTRNLATKIHALLTDLGERLSEEQQATEAKAKAAKESALVASRIAELEAELAKLKGKPAKQVKATGPKSSSTEQVPLAVIRQWAWDNNITCPKTGVVRRDVRQAYNAANPSESRRTA
jgi:hypothetical protein